MQTIPKPIHCGQNWLDMKPSETGRICGQCQKNIVDFSKMKWPEIEALQQANNNSICGMYSPKQLEHWVGKYRQALVPDLQKQRHSWLL